MPVRTLFVLAGYKASGKSTLLTRAVEQRLPLFGADDDPRFQTTRLPSRWPEWQLSFAEVLAEGSWFSEFHIPELQRCDQLPDHVTLHIDLLQLYFYGCGLTSPPEDARLQGQRSSSQLFDASLNDVLTRHFWQQPLFRRFDRIVVNTLYVPFAVAAARFAARRQRAIMQLSKTAAMRSSKTAAHFEAQYQHFLTPGPAQAATHAALDDAWLRGVSAPCISRALICASEDDRIAFLTPPTAGPADSATLERSYFDGGRLRTHTAAPSQSATRYRAPAPAWGSQRS